MEEVKFLLDDDLSFCFLTSSDHFLLLCEAFAFVDEEFPL